MIQFYLYYKNGDQEYVSRYYTAENLIEAECHISNYREKTLKIYPREKLKNLKVKMVGLNTKEKKDLESIVKAVSKKK